MADDTNPTLRRRELGSLLRQLRHDRGLSMEEVTERAMFSATKLSRLETGRVGATSRDIRDLCLVYGIVDEAERDRLMTLAKEGKQRAWWRKYGLPDATYVELEVEASSIRTFHSDVVPGLLQVESYARAIFESAADPPLEEPEIEQRFEVRMRRQAILADEGGPRIHFLLDEAALHRPVGGPAVMRSQIAHLIEIGQLPKVTLQIVPLAVGAHPAMDANFVILEFESENINDTVYVEGTVGTIYMESRADLERYCRIFHRLESLALDPNNSRALAAKTAETYR